MRVEPHRWEVVREQGSGYQTSAQEHRFRMPVLPVKYAEDGDLIRWQWRTRLVLTLRLAGGQGWEG
jgi:hypothetical protein